MPGNRSFTAQILEIWNRLEKPQRISLVLFTALALAALGSLVFYMNRMEYEVLYRDLSPEDAQAIAAKLKEEKREFKVEGTTILVAGPKEEVDKLRLELAGSGLVRSGRVGYEIFDKSPFGMTDFTEQVNLQRALEGELARTISALAEIEHARVHLVLPKDSVFQENREPAKASVAVRLRRGAELSRSSIAGIRGLVAGAVPGLEHYNVSIVNDEGRLLSRVSDAAGAERDEIESGIREQLEKQMVAKVISILEPVVGRGKVQANASIEIDVNSTEQTEETFNPAPPAIVSQQKTEERLGAAAAVSGVPGTQSNVSGVAAAVQGQGPERMRQSETTNYEISKLVRHTIQPKGSVRRISVAVALDYKAIYNKGADGKVTVAYEPRPQKDLDAFRELVNAAVGYNKQRGDVVTLENVPFYTDVRPYEEAPSLPWYKDWRPLLHPAAKYGAFLLLFLLAYGMLFRPMMKRVSQVQALPAPAAEENAGQIAGDMAEPKAIAGDTLEEEPEPAIESPAAKHLPEHNDVDQEPVDLERIDDQIERDFMKEASLVELGERKYSVLKKKLVECARKEPEMVSQLVRTWIQQKE